MVLGGSLVRQNLMPLARPAVLSAGLASALARHRDRPTGLPVRYP
jgi:hypothetical protein